MSGTERGINNSFLETKLTSRIPLHCGHDFVVVFSEKQLLASGPFCHVLCLTGMSFSCNAWLILAHGSNSALMHSLHNEEAQDWFSTAAGVGKWAVTCGRSRVVIDGHSMSWRSGVHLAVTACVRAARWWRWFHASFCLLWWMCAEKVMPLWWRQAADVSWSTLYFSMQAVSGYNAVFLITTDHSIRAMLQVG